MLARRSEKVPHNCYLSCSYAYLVIRRIRVQDWSASIACSAIRGRRPQIRGHKPAPLDQLRRGTTIENGQEVPAVGPYGIPRPCLPATVYSNINSFVMIGPCAWNRPQHCVCSCETIFSYIIKRNIRRYGEPSRMVVSRRAQLSSPSSAVYSMGTVTDTSVVGVDTVHPR